MIWLQLKGRSAFRAREVNVNHYVLRQNRRTQKSQRRTFWKLHSHPSPAKVFTFGQNWGSNKHKLTNHKRMSFFFLCVFCLVSCLAHSWCSVYVYWLVVRLRRDKERQHRSVWNEDSKEEVGVRNLGLLLRLLAITGTALLLCMPLAGTPWAAACPAAAYSSTVILCITFLVPFPSPSKSLPLSSGLLEKCVLCSLNARWFTPTEIFSSL